MKKKEFNRRLEYLIKKHDELINRKNKKKRFMQLAMKVITLSHISSANSIANTQSKMKYEGKSGSIFRL